MNFRFMRLLDAILNTDKRTTQNRSSFIDPALRLIVSLLAILLCALSRNAFFTVSVIAVELLRTALLSADSIRAILKRTLLPVLFTTLIMLPSVFLGSPGTFGTVTMKVFESVLILSLLNEEIPWNEMTTALSRLHVPELLVMILDTTVRFLVLLGRFADRILEAVSLRRVGQKNWKNAGTGGVLGVTWLKSQQMLKANTEAMICRGFAGSYRKNFSFEPETKSVKSRRKITSLAYSLLFPLLIVFFAYTQSIL